MALAISSLRDADWLGDTRTRAVMLTFAVTLPGLAVVWIAMSRGGIDPAGHPIGTDYLSFWTAARFAVSGEAAAAYDIAAHHAAQRTQAGTDPGYAAFFYPPTFLLALLPFGLFGYFTSLALWLGTTLAAYWHAFRGWACGWSAASLALIAYPAVLSNAGHGQNAFLTAALIGGGALLVERRPWLAGVLLGALIIKPHLALVIPFALLFRGEWRSIAAAAASAAALCLAALLVLGSESWIGFFEGTALARTTLENGLVDPAKMQSLFAAARLLGTPLPLAYGLQAALFALALLGLFLVARAGADARAQGATMTAAALVSTPFLLDYDLTLAAFPMVWMFIEARRTGFLPWEKIVLAAAFILPLISRSLAMSAGIPLAPLVLGALFLLVVRRARSDHRHAAVDVDGLPSDVGALAAR
nr:glycosyltransferase family 87 protein [uncultured Sphingosinicella sp.]